MFDGDIIIRSICYPKCFEQRDAAHFSQELFIDFVGNVEKTIYSMSTASRYLLETVENCHNYGCDVAETMNDRIRIKSGRDPIPFSDKVHYLGFYNILAKAVFNVKLEHYEASIVWRPENGNSAHFEVVLELVRPFSAAATNKDKKLTRSREQTLARTMIAKGLFGPERGICDVDFALAEDLSRISLKLINPVTSKDLDI